MSFPFNADIDQFGVTMRDAKGNVSKSRFYVDFGGGSGVTDAQSWEVTFLPLWTALSNAALQRTSGAESRYGIAQYGAHAPSDYQTIEQKAVFVFQDAVGNLHRYQVPAPKIALFQADRQTIDPSNSAVIAFKNYMTTPDTNGVFACTKDGQPFSNFMGGYFRAAKLQRKLNVLVLTPALTPADPAE